MMKCDTKNCQSNMAGLCGRRAAEGVCLRRSDSNRIARLEKASIKMMEEGLKRIE